MPVTIWLLGPDADMLPEQIADDVFDDAINPAYLADYLADRSHRMAVALCDGWVVGQARAILNRQPDAPTALFLDNLGVTPDHRRQGIATALVEALMGWGREQGGTELWVPLECDNVEAQAFYASIGATARPILIASRAL